MIPKEEYYDLGVFEGKNLKNFITDLSFPIILDELTEAVAEGQLYTKRDRIIYAVEAIERAFPKHDLIWDWDLHAHRLVEKRVRQERVAQESAINRKRLLPESALNGNQIDKKESPQEKLDLETFMKEL